MSLITMIVAREKSLVIAEMHYRDAERIINEIGSMEPKLEPIILSKASLWLDGGYILIDYASYMIISRQNCFRVKETFPWTVLDVI